MAVVKRLMWLLQPCVHRDVICFTQSTCGLSVFTIAVDSIEHFIPQTNEALWGWTELVVPSDARGCSHALAPLRRRQYSCGETWSNDEKPSLTLPRAAADGTSTLNSVYLYHWLTGGWSYREPTIIYRLNVKRLAAACSWVHVCRCDVTTTASRPTTDTTPANDQTVDAHRSTGA